MLNELCPAQYKLVKCNSLCANFRARSYFFVVGLFMGVTDLIHKTLSLFTMIYYSSSYLGLLLSLEEYVLSAAVTVGRYLFLFTLAILE